MNGAGDATGTLDRNAYVVLMGDVGSGKSTIMEKLTGLGGFSSKSSTSWTVDSTLALCPSQNLMVCDTPGSNAMANKFEHNMWIAEAINFRSVSRLLIVVKADTRIDNVIETARRYIEGFLDLPNVDDLLAICITHMDQVEWTTGDLRTHLRDQLGFETAVFSGMDTPGTEVARQIRQICTTQHNMCVDDRNFLKFFNISNNNVKIIRSTRREVANFRNIYTQFVDHRGQFSAKEQTDLIFEFQAWMQEQIIQAQQRVSEENEFSFVGDRSMSEIGHIANMTNQMRSILYDVRTEALGYQSHHGVNELRKCPFCGLIWAKILGCDGNTTCGSLVNEPDTRNQDFNVLATFSFGWADDHLAIDRSGDRQAKLRPHAKEGVGCGRTVNWSEMVSVPVPEEFAEARGVTVEDVELLPNGTARSTWFSSFYDVATGVRDRFRRKKRVTESACDE